MSKYVRKRYIDAEILKSYLNPIARKTDCHFLQLIDNIPTADVEEVVRCNDCIFFETAYYDSGTKQVCRLYQRQMKEDDFCAYGEKMDGGNDET